MSKQSEKRSDNYRVKNYMVKKVTCPVCGALPGYNCTGKRKQKRYTCHKERWLAAEVPTTSKIQWEEAVCG